MGNLEGFLAGAFQFDMGAFSRDIPPFPHRGYSSLFQAFFSAHRESTPNPSRAIALLRAFAATFSCSPKKGIPRPRGVFSFEFCLLPMSLNMCVSLRMASTALSTVLSLLVQRKDQRKDAPTPPPVPGSLASTVRSGGSSNSATERTGGLKHPLALFPDRYRVRSAAA